MVLQLCVLFFKVYFLDNFTFERGDLVSYVEVDPIGYKKLPLGGVADVVSLCRFPSYMEFGSRLLRRDRRCCRMTCGSRCASRGRHVVRDAQLLKSGVVGEGRATASRCEGLLGFPSRGGLVEAHEEYMPQGHPPNCHLFSPPSNWRAVLPVEDKHESRGTCAGRHM